MSNSIGTFIAPEMTVGEQVAFLKTILESFTEYSIIAMDLEGRILNWNTGARRDYGYRAEDMVGKRNASILHTPEDLAGGKVDAFMATALRTGKAQAMFERVRQGGRRFTASVALSLRRGAAGTPIGYLLISKDITSQKRRHDDELEEQNRRVRQANRLKGEFLANMSHELRTPLNAIIGFSELLHDGRAGAVTSKQKSYVGDVLTNARHLLRLINDVLDLSKVESGKMEFFPEPVDPNRVAAEVRDILRTLTARMRIRLHTEIDPTLEQVVLDPARLKQVLFNYLSNALKFTPEEGRVTIRMRTAGSSDLLLEVDDTGIGIRPEDIPRLFVEFEQLDASASKKYQGTGLGLALTRRIVEAQGGRVGVTSTPGKGSIFSATLPRVDHAHLTGPAAPLKKEPCSGAPTVLVIEDEPRDRQWLVTTLRGAGYVVESAATGTEALRLLSERRFDAITLDLMLPDMSGWEVLRRMRAGRLNRALPGVVVTVLADEGAGIGFAIHDFLEKPVEQRNLLEALNRARVNNAEKGMTILLVDDNRQDLKLFQAALDQNGYAAIATSSAMTALRIAAQKPPDVVVLDLVMPRVDGFEFLRRFRASEHGSKTPVIVLTANDLAPKEKHLFAAMARNAIAKGGSSVRALLAEISATLGHVSIHVGGADATNGVLAEEVK